MDICLIYQNMLVPHWIVFLNIRKSSWVLIFNLTALGFFVFCLSVFPHFINPIHMCCDITLWLTWTQRNKQLSNIQTSRIHAGSPWFVRSPSSQDISAISRLTKSLYWESSITEATNSPAVYAYISDTWLQTVTIDCYQSIFFQHQKKLSFHCKGETKNRIWHSIYIYLQRLFNAAQWHVLYFHTHAHTLVVCGDSP